LWRPDDPAGDTMKFGRLFSFLRMFRHDFLVLLIALRHPDTPRRVKGLLALAILYLVSPIDLMPDAIPFLGIVDDAVVVPTAVCGLMSLLPSHVRSDSEMRAARAARRLPFVILLASLFVLAWIALIIYGLYSLFT